MALPPIRHWSRALSKQRRQAITRGYGNPSAGVHAIQIETAQSAYLNEGDTKAYDDVFAGRIRDFLRLCVEALI